jgi:hypothetical protein
VTFWSFSLQNDREIDDCESAAMNQRGDRGSTNNDRMEMNEAIAMPHQ